MKVQHRGYWYGSLLLAVGAGVCSRNLPNSLSSRQIAQRNTERIADQVEPLCRLLVPDHETLRFMVYPSILYRKDDSHRHLAIVDCLDAKDKVIIHLIWNEDTRHVVEISQFDRPAVHPLMSPLNSVQAVETARKWTQFLDLARSAEVWNSPYKVVDTGAILRVRLNLREGVVVVWISAETGEILNTFAHDTLGYASPPAITVEESGPPTPEG